LFHGKICVKGSKDRTYFVLKGEDVGDALRAICVDATTSKGQGKDVSNGGYFSTLASIKSIEGNSDTLSLPMGEPEKARQQPGRLRSSRLFLQSEPRGELLVGVEGWNVSEA